MLRVGQYENIFILCLRAIKTAGLAQKFRVGRVIGNTAVFYLRLMQLYERCVHILHMTVEKCVKQIDDPFLVFTKLDHVGLTGTVKVIALYLLIFCPVA